MPIAGSITNSHALTGSTQLLRTAQLLSPLCEGNSGVPYIVLLLLEKVIFNRASEPQCLVLLICKRNFKESFFTDGKIQNARLLSAPHIPGWT